MSSDEFSNSYSLVESTLSVLQHDIFDCKVIGDVNLL